MTRKQHRIRKKLDLFRIFEQELEDELRRGLTNQHNKRVEITKNIDTSYSKRLERECFTSEHPNHNK
jgi:hypothetical protein